MHALLLVFALAAQDAPPEPTPIAPLEPEVEPPPIEPRDDEEPEPEENEDEDEADEPDDNGIEIGPDEREATLVSETRLTLGGRLGVAAGNVLAVPFFLPGPGAFLTGSQKLAAFDLFFVGADGGLSLGINENGDFSSLAGYKGRALAGIRLAFGDYDPGEFGVFLTLEGDLHAGLTSVALVPVPRMGFGGEATLAVPVCCDEDIKKPTFTLDGAARMDFDLLVILPAPAASIEGGFTARWGPAFVRGRAGIDADAIVAIVANSFSASLFLAVTGGVDLDLLYDEP